ARAGRAAPEARRARRASGARGRDALLRRALDRGDRERAGGLARDREGRLVHGAGLPASRARRREGAVKAELYRRARECFVRAIELEPREREAFLDAQCTGDPELRAEVASLLVAHEQGRGFDSRPPGGASAGPSPLETARYPERIGRYRILDVLGEGGMG